MEVEVKPKVIAFYLPQYYPIKENDECYGKGFTEWTNVGKAKPLFPGHYQPRIPADLGYYDLRIPEVREAQAELAAKAGISAFCYYHYWFGNGKQVLEMPLKEVIKTGKPDIPFCIAWANHSWYKKTWDSTRSILNKEILIKQEYPGLDDIIEHFNSLFDAFNDGRYFKIHGKLVFVFYKAENIPYIEELKVKWEELAINSGLPGFFFIAYADDKEKILENSYKNCDAIILSLTTNSFSIGYNNKIRKFFRATSYLLAEKLHLPLQVYTYKSIIKRLVDSVLKEETIYPIILPNWDYTPRRGSGGLIIHNSNPKLFKRHVLDIFNLIKHKNNDNKVVFLKSWNEWGEGNYIEPDLKYGKGYLEALKEAIDESY